MNDAEKITQLERIIEKLGSDLVKIKMAQLRKKYCKMTIGEIAKKWNESTSDERWDMIDEIPNMDRTIKERSYEMDLKIRDLELDIIDNDWGKQEYFDVDEEFEWFCRPKRGD